MSSLKALQEQATGPCAADSGGWTIRGTTSHIQKAVMNNNGHYVHMYVVVRAVV